MLKKLILENWKSFRYAELPIDPLTVLIGTNASGKSNAIEALEFIKRISQGKSLQSALLGDQGLEPIRGGIEWATYNSRNQFTLKITFQNGLFDVNTGYPLDNCIYSITVEASPKLRLISEALSLIEESAECGDLKERHIFEVGLSDDLSLNVRVNDIPKEFKLSDYCQSFLSSFNYSTGIFPGNTINKTVAGRTVSIFKNIFTLNPIPSEMRSFSSLSETLQSDASNLSGVLAALPDKEKTRVEETLSRYAAHLPEKDILRVWAEPVGRLYSDAMLYCEEARIPGEEPRIVDARAMSDGTLRFIAILTALLTRPEGSQLIVEEVDNGLHPSRAGLLLNMLREIGEKRQIDILVTTHNPALLDALPPTMIPFVIVVHRDPETGESKLTPLDGIENLPKLLASGSLGKLAERGSIERSLSGAK